MSGVLRVATLFHNDDTDVRENDESISMDIGADKGALSSLVDATEDLLGAVRADAPQYALDVRHISDYLSSGRFEVAVFGEFNRGKSTLINALMLRQVLPSGVLPVTAVPTELSQGDDLAVVRYTDGGEEIIDLTQIETYVTEEANPGNRRRVEAVRVKVPTPALHPGVVLVDTPGVNSIFRSSSQLARDLVTRADAAIVVLSADAPLSDSERLLLRMLSKRSARTFFVLNRIDHLDQAELERVQWFVENVLRELFGADQQLFSLSARTGEGVQLFSEALQKFFIDGLDDARSEVVRYDIATLADRISNDISLEERALALSAVEFDDRMNKFGRAAGWQGEAFNDDCVLFEHSVGRIVANMRQALEAASAGLDSPEMTARLTQIANNTSGADIERSLEAAIEDEIRTRFEPLRRRITTISEQAWQRAVERFERATTRRAQKLRAVAGDLFEVDLQHTDVSRPGEQISDALLATPITIAVPKNVLGRVFKPLLPQSRNRQRLVQAAQARLIEETRRHAQNFGDDLETRIRTAANEFQQQMTERVTSVGTAVAQAMDHGQALRAANEDTRQEFLAKAARIHSATDAARAACFG